MDINILGFSDLFWIGMIAFAACLAFGLYMVITKKPGIVRGVKASDDYRDKEMFAKNGGILLICLSFACLVMVGLSFVNTFVSNIVGLAAFMVFAFFWKRMHDKYGPR